DPRWKQRNCENLAKRNTSPYPAGKAFWLGAAKRGLVVRVTRVEVEEGGESHASKADDRQELALRQALGSDYRGLHARCVLLEFHSTCPRPGSDRWHDRHDHRSLGCSYSRCQGNGNRCVARHHLADSEQLCGRLRPAALAGKHV